MYINDLIRRAARPAAFAGIHIKSVSISATYDDSHKAVITITWTFPAGVSVDSQPLPGVTQEIYSRPSDAVIPMARKGMAPSDIEEDVLFAAWKLGAWDLRRIEKAPLADLAKRKEMGCGITHSFGDDTYSVNGQVFSSGYKADEASMLEAAMDGYITWSFVPLCMASEIARARWGDKDKTLKSDLTRDGEPQISRGKWERPREPLTACEHIYQLGRGNHGNRSKQNRSRRG